MKTYEAWPHIEAYEEGGKFIVQTEELEGEQVEVLYRKGHPGKTRKEVDEMVAAGKQVRRFSICAPFNPRIYDCGNNILCMQDTCIILRGGTKIYADIYRPNTDKPVPLIVSWGPFGKRPSEGMDEWKLMGVPPKTVSNMAKYECADPAYWCHYGYAVANCDPRGVGHSEGNVSNFGIQDGRDGADFIEWAAKQDWCTGKVGMFGNSGVGMVQWKIAAEQPEHLACIAVWEGTGDLYRESMMIGGIPNPIFNDAIAGTVASEHYIEDGCNMLLRHPFYDAYWKSKTPHWKDIKVLAYICGGWCHFHLRGSLEGFRKIRSRKKWLRIHRDMEWPDTYKNENLEDLRKFFDRYLKEIHNGWEFTPAVRHDLMDAYGFDAVHNKEEDHFPISRTEYRKIYLDAASNTAADEEIETESELVYDPDKETAVFEYTFKEDTELTGYFKLHMNIECRGYDNMDMFIWLKKYKADGEYVPVTCMKEPYRGAWGYFRGSRRELDPELSTEYNPVQAQRKDEPMEEGQIYPVDIEIWPTSRLWHAGEKLRIEITGHFVKSEWYEDGHMEFLDDNGDGMHVFHTGGQYSSWLQIPVIPPKYQSGSFIVR